jgi:hypothetical protein
MGNMGVDAPMECSIWLKIAAQVGLSVLVLCHYECAM